MSVTTVILTNSILYLKSFFKLAGSNNVNVVTSNEISKEYIYKILTTRYKQLQQIWMQGKNILFSQRDRAVAKLKVTPCLKCLHHCYDNERRPVEERNSKKCTVALSLRDTICPSEWSPGVHDWTM